MTVKGKRVLVTGGTSGIGEATAHAYARVGADVVITGRDKERGREIVESLRTEGLRARFVQADLTRPEDVRRLADEIEEVDVLINNAGVFPFGPTHEVDGALFDATFALNVRAPFFLTGAFAPRMAANGGGAIVNVSTMVASFGASGMALYGATKAAVELLTKAWAAEYGPEGVRVNAIAPGPPGHRVPNPWAMVSTSWRPRFRSVVQPPPRRSPTQPCSWARTKRPTSTGPCSRSTRPHRRLTEITLNRSESAAAQAIKTKGHFPKRGGRRRRLIREECLNVRGEL